MSGRTRFPAKRLDRTAAPSAPRLPARVRAGILALAAACFLVTVARASEEPPASPAIATVEAAARRCNELDEVVKRLDEARDEYTMLEAVGARIRTEIKLDSGASMFDRVQELEGRMEDWKKRDPAADADPSFRALVEEYNDLNARYRLAVTAYVRRDLVLEFHDIRSYDDLARRYAVAASARQAREGRHEAALTERERACADYERAAGSLDEERIAREEIAADQVLARVVHGEAVVVRKSRGRLRERTVRAGDPLTRGDTLRTGAVAGIRIDVIFPPKEDWLAGLRPSGCTDGAGDSRMTFDIGPRSEFEVHRIVSELGDRPPWTLWQLVRGALFLSAKGPFYDCFMAVRAGSTICGIRDGGIELPADRHILSGPPQRSFFLAHEPEVDRVELLVQEGSVELGTSSGRVTVGAGRSVTAQRGRVGTVTALDPKTWQARLSASGTVGASSPAAPEPWAVRWGCAATGNACATVQLEGRHYETQYHRLINQMGVPIESYFYPVLIDGQEVHHDGQKLWNRFVRVPAANHPDQTGLQRYHVTWVRESGGWSERETRVAAFEASSEASPGATTNAAEAEVRSELERLLQLRAAMGFIVGDPQAVSPQTAPAPQPAPLPAQRPGPAPSGAWKLKQRTLAGSNGVLTASLGSSGSSATIRIQLPRVLIEGTHQYPERGVVQRWVTEASIQEPPAMLRNGQAFDLSWTMSYRQQIFNPNLAADWSDRLRLVGAGVQEGGIEHGTWGRFHVAAGPGSPQGSGVVRVAIPELAGGVWFYLESQTHGKLAEWSYEPVDGSVVPTESADPLGQGR